MEQHIEQRMRALERRLRITQTTFGLFVLCTMAVITTGMSSSSGDVHDEVRTRKLVIVDDKDVQRVVLGQDAVDTQRRSRATGLTMYDGTGAERGGFSTFDDGSVVFAMDAPGGVGSPMRDRLGLVVWPDGSSYVMLIDNETKGVVKLTSDGAGKGGLQVFDWNDSTRKVNIRTLNYGKDEFTSMSYGE